MGDVQRLIADGLSSLNLSLSNQQQSCLLEYVSLLSKWNNTYNLTALRDDTQIVSHHILDSLTLTFFMDSTHTLLDVGSGGGMPGIPVAIVRPDVQVTVLDANSKKTSFLQQTVIELGLNNVTVVNERVESWQSSRFDTITSRAFAQLGDFVRMTEHLILNNGIWLAMKGVYPYEEIMSLPENIKVDTVHSVNVPNLDAQRHIVVMTHKKE
ncbi:MAG: 16S rRNA (guanine(527)-N(7))-methyltransferase RsmG [Neisseriaceae bacterium]|nr:16S rRNA (guanine(527)-N(7))-methyltransferase RsmG [Neisseriaceae bacterium]